MNLLLLDNKVEDYCPWKELVDFSKTFNLEKMDLISHKNVPYFIILIQALENYLKNNNNPNDNPKTKGEKFEKFLKSLMLKTGTKGENEN